MAQQSIGIIALEYTLIGMGVVFLVLIFISFIISLFKFIPGSGAYNKKKKETAAEVQAAPVIKEQPAPEAVTAAVPDDGQLIAVITAAIKAYMDQQGVKGDGYVVRSIKRR